MPFQLNAWIDTGFNGELVVPRHLIESAGLQQTAAVDARLADGSLVTLESFSCMIDWFGQDRAVEVIASDGELPLLGIGLLRDRRLVADYATSAVEIT